LGPPGASGAHFKDTALALVMFFSKDNAAFMRSRVVLISFGLSDLVVNSQCVLISFYLSVNGRSIFLNHWQITFNPTLISSCHPTAFKPSSSLPFQT
jgi:hypothetical protein